MANATHPDDFARDYADLFRAVYLCLHRRDAKRRPLSGASRAVLLHLAQTGPLTIGECAKHLQRTQSVVSEIVDQLEGHGLLERVRDPDDRRRALVWLTDAARERMVADQEVLSLARLRATFRAMTADERAQGRRRHARPRAGGRGNWTVQSQSKPPMAMKGTRKMKIDHSCESCSMPIETGRYCAHCVTANGDLQPFDDRFEKMVGWQMRRNPGLTRADAEQQTLAFMSKMPAWKDDPRLTSALR